MEASVVVCQCFVAGCLGLGSSENDWMQNHFTHLFVDESSQSFECEALVSVLAVGDDCSIVLVGDPKQLSPTVRDPVAARAGLSLSLQERLMGLPLYTDNEHCVMTTLLANYRSHNALLKVPSELFYNGRLKCLASPKISSVCKDFELLEDGENFPMMVYDVSKGKEMSKLDTPSYYNIEECEAVAKLIEALIRSENVSIHAGEVAVITCFRAQVLKMREILRSRNLSSVNVGVVEDFQGQEQKVVLISTVLTHKHERWSSATGGLGFMTDPKRFNVAITRASALCVIVGHVGYLEDSGSYWTALIDYVRRNHGLNGDGNGEALDHYDYEEDYGVSQFIQRVEELNLLGSGYEEDRYELAMRGYFQDAPEWKVILS
uniref:RNA helicase n=1 Tax=Leptocylindrus danicus TaxID=163516 RepID=A0A7S2PN77_9STRA